MRDYYDILDKHEVYKSIITSRHSDILRIENELANMHDSVINHPENVRLRDHLGVLRQEMLNLTRGPVTELHSILFTTLDGCHRFMLNGYNGSPAYSLPLVRDISLSFKMDKEPPSLSRYADRRNYKRYSSQYYPCGDTVHIIHEYKEEVE